MLLRAGGRLRRRAMAEKRWSDATILAGGVIIAAIVVLSLIAPLIGYAHPDAQDLTSSLQSPSAKHLFGTDSLGRDIWTRSLYAARVDLVFAVIVTYAPVALGLV